MSVRIIHAHVLEGLRGLPDESVHCVVTSPPYWGLRSYGIPPQVWGGDPSCAHEWGQQIKLHKGGPHGDGVMLDGGRSVVDAQAAVKDIPAGQFCRHCNAWRGDLGLEPTYPLYVEHMVSVFRDVRRVLRRDGTCWMNLGDSYATGAGAVGAHPGGGAQGAAWSGRGDNRVYVNGRGEPQATPTKNGATGIGPMTQPNRMPQPGLKPKDLCMIPHRVAIALQDDGWWIRQDIVWSKPNPMPESCTDRCTKAHEYLFLMARSERYYYDATAIYEESSEGTNERRSKYPNGKKPIAGWAVDGNDHSAITHAREKNSGRKLADAGYGIKNNESFDAAMAVMPPYRNKRSVWTITTKPFPEAHFATFPPDLVAPCILAGTSARGVCSSCGAPRERVVEKGAPLEEQKRASGADSNGEYHGQATKPYAGTGAEDPSAVKARILEGMRERITVGWVPTCECDNAADVVQATVMDPFGGSGTVGLVADRLHRDAILIELGGQYVEMARKRISGDAPLFAEVT